MPLHPGQNDEFSMPCSSTLKCAVAATSATQKARKSQGKASARLVVQGAALAPEAVLDAVQQRLHARAVLLLQPGRVQARAHLLIPLALALSPDQVRLQQPVVSVWDGQASASKPLPGLEHAFV